MHSGDRLAPGVVTLGLVEHQMASSNRVDSQIFASELGGHCVLLPECPVLSLTVLREHGRMVTHLKTEHLIELIGRYTLLEHWGGGGFFVQPFHLMHLRCKPN